MNLNELVTAAEHASDAPPGSPEWSLRCTASKVAAILGQSPWSTRYEVWHQLAGNRASGSEPTYAMLRGTHLEDGVANLWHALNPEWQMEETTTWRSKERPWQYATPDRLLLDPEGQLFNMEVKTTVTWNGWGPDGSTVVPPEYWRQAGWQSDTLGLPVLLVALGPRFEMRVYELHFTEWELETAREYVEEFLLTLPGRPNEQEPDPTPPDMDTLLAVTPVYRGWARELDDDNPDALALAEARILSDALAGEMEESKFELVKMLEEAEALRWRGITLISRRSNGTINVAQRDTIRKALTT